MTHFQDEYMILQTEELSRAPRLRVRVRAALAAQCELRELSTLLSGLKSSHIIMLSNLAHRLHPQWVQVALSDSELFSYTRSAKSLVYGNQVMDSSELSLEGFLV